MSEFDLIAVSLGSECMNPGQYPSHATSANREYVEHIIPPSRDEVGDRWGPPEFCPDKSFAKGFELKVNLYLHLKQS